MQCPYCNSFSNRVIDKRTVKGSGETRRRRECLKCGSRFTTYERLVPVEMTVLKKSGEREPFIREKLRIGILKALEKRPSLDKADFLVDRIERTIRTKFPKEVSSKIIGRLVLTELKKVDKVAYLRFASVYRQFDNPGDFARELTSLGN